MSLIITVYCSEGIVMASDSRTTYNYTQTIPVQQEGQLPRVIENNGIHFTDTAYKTFLSDNGIGVSTCGASTINGKPITGMIEEVLRLNKNSSVTDLAQKIYEFFSRKAPQQSTEFIVAGYEKTNDDLVQKVYRINTLNPNFEIIDTHFPGAIWGGEFDILSRILSEELYLRNKTPEGNIEYNKHIWSPIIWEYFTLQDCIEFAEYAVKTTIDTMKFQGRVKTVGGPIDILVIKPSESIWIAHKELHSNT